MFKYLVRFSPITLLIIALSIFVIISPYSNLNLAAFLIIIFFILNKIVGEYFILVLLAGRPFLDYWRDYSLFSLYTVNFNINAAVSVLLLLWSAYFFIKNKEHFKKIPALWPWLLFIIWCSITYFYSFDTASTITETLKAANLFALFGISYILYLKDGEKFRKRFFYAAIAGAVIPITFALYQFFTATGLTIDGVPNRIYGTFAHPNIMSTFVLFLLMLVAEDYYLKKHYYGSLTKHKIAAIFLIILIALTYTRIAWIAAAFFIFVLGLKHFRKYIIYLVVCVGLFYALFYPINNYLTTNYNYNLQKYSIIARLTSRNEESDSIAWRADLYNKVLPLFRERALQGYGYGSFSKVWDDNKGVENLWDNTSEAHNDYLKVGFEAGTVGIFLFLSIFAVLIYKQIIYGRKNNWKNLVFLASILSYLVLSASDNMLHHTPVIWWIWAVWGVWGCEYDENRK